MSFPLLLDSSILACVVRPEVAENQPVAQVILPLLEDPRVELFVPEIIDYELRRKLLHLGQHRHHARKWAREALTLLDELVAVGYIPLTTGAMRLAAELWAKTRSEGRLRGTDESLDVDVILAAQAKQVGGRVVTMNEKHFRDLVDVFDWRSPRSAHGLP
jgi:predicted nucleic acid-binding protein